MLIHQQYTWNIAVGHRFNGYVHVFEAFYDAQYCFGMCYNDLILLGAIHLIIKHQNSYLLK